MSAREERPCRDDDLIRDYVGDGREYRGHNGACDNCGKEFHESDDSDLSNAHWMHTIESGRAYWEVNTPDDVKMLALVMDPDDPKLTNRAPLVATEHASAILASDWLAKHDAEVGERIAKAIEADIVRTVDGSLNAYALGEQHAAHIARDTTTTEVGA